MLEAYAHKKMKQLLLQDASSWPHHLTVSRLVARSLRRKDHTLIQLEPSSQDEWLFGLMVSLGLEQCGAVIIVSNRLRSKLVTLELPRIRRHGFSISCWEGLDPPPQEQIWLLDFSGFVNAYRKGYLQGRQLIVPEAEFLNARLRESILIEIKPNDWESLCRANPSGEKAYLNFFEDISLRLFASTARLNPHVPIDYSDVLAFKDLSFGFGQLPEPWQSVLEIDLDQWATWAELDHKMLTWVWKFKPFEPLFLLQGLLRDQPTILFSGSGKNSLLVSELVPEIFPSPVVVAINELKCQEPIQLFLPKRQPRPNTEVFSEHLLAQSRRLVLGRRGLTVILLDDFHLRLQLTAALAAEFGSRVVHETTAVESNGALCCRWSWWLQHHHRVPLPEQLIIALLPLASLESPYVFARVQSLKRQGRDWFRDFLLPEALSLLPLAVAPLRKGSGRLAILDGRLRSRSWGEDFLRILEPWTPLHRLLPD